MRTLRCLPLAAAAFSACGAAQAGGTAQPDTMSLGAGYFDFDKNGSHRQSADFRIEYRWGLSLLPLVSPYFKQWDPYVQVHPYLGLENNTRASFYALGGLNVDLFATRHIVLTWGEGIGFFHAGQLPSLGSAVEFRSMAEAGWRFDSGMRLTAEFSHISNAGVARSDPGAEIVGLYLHVPVGPR